MRFVAKHRYINELKFFLHLVHGARLGAKHVVDVLINRLFPKNRVGRKQPPNLWIGRGACYMLVLDWPEFSEMIEWE
ncbi:MAG: hypothetical protein CSA68_09655 [Rhodobacterales bacterium]|nr:MAG: hypothetical protein CSA68_09655 [Rhodobacterales bacterium]